MANNKPKYIALLQDKGLAQKASNAIKQIFEDVHSLGHPQTGSPIKIGKLPFDIKLAFKNITNKDIICADTYTSSKALLHHRGGQKAANGKETPESDLIAMPKLIASMDVYENTGALIFTDYKNKYIVEVNKEIKLNGNKSKVCCHISSSHITDIKEFNNYNTIKKKK